LEPSVEKQCGSQPCFEEDEFFDLEEFASRGDFLARVHPYQLYFNLVRPNSHKENQSPWQIIERLAPRSPRELCLLPPVFLDDYLHDSGGYHVPRLPQEATVVIWKQDGDCGLLPKGRVG
jgi:hypothetical protein